MTSTTTPRVSGHSRSTDSLVSGIGSGPDRTHSAVERGQTHCAEVVASMQRELVEQAMGGDIDAYSELVRTSHRRLFGIASLILRDADLAQDAVQDALLLAWRHVRSLRDPDAWDAWLRRLTVRACYKAAKSHSRRKLVELHLTRDIGSAGVPDSSSGVADREWLGRELDRLDLDQRIVLVLHYYLDLPVSEVAEIVGIPYGTAASRLHRGLEAMRASMHTEPPTDTALGTERSR
jgi:RNA polymerase sigma-70 factor (ECF subfamily)